ncbi:MAG: hypothetical protein Q9219_005060 [cf. Caloplaca sp. 3 TL-2023]
MSEDVAELALEAASPIIQNYDKVTDPAKEKAKQQMERMRGRRNHGRGYDDEYVDYDRYDHPRRGSDRRDRPRRGDDYYDDDYDRTGGGRARSTGRDAYGGQSSLSPRRAYKHRKSLGEQALAALGLGGVLGAEKERERDRRSSRERRSDRDRAYRREGRDRGYSEAGKQLPAGYLGYNERQGYQPDGSNAGTIARRNGYNGGQSVVSKSKGNSTTTRGEKRKSSSESSSESSSDVCSSSEDERRQKKMRGKEFLTAGLAAVATIHAAQGVYKSMEARDKRHAEVASGEMAPEEAARLRRKAHLQDAAAIGIAALGIKGAYSEWQEVQEHRKEAINEKHERAKRHEKREKKREKYGYSNYGSSRHGGDGRFAMGFADIVSRARAGSLLRSPPPPPTSYDELSPANEKQPQHTNPDPQASLQSHGYTHNGNASSPNTAVQLVVRTVPTWVHVLEDDEENGSQPATRLLPPSPPTAQVAQHHYQSSDQSSSRPKPPRGRLHDHERDSVPPLPRGYPSEHISRWRAFANASAYPTITSEGGEIVTHEWLAQNGADYTKPWMAGAGEEDAEMARGFKAKRKVWWKRLQRTIIRSPMIPLVLRSIVWVFSLVALAVAASLHHEPDDASTEMAIIVDAIALVYLLYITYDEYSGKPLGLRSARAKMRLIFLDLFFIVFDSANLSLAFEAVQDANPCPDNAKIKESCHRQNTLASVLLIALIAWLLTFSISVLRLVERVTRK